MFDPKKIKAVAIDIDGTLADENSVCRVRTENAVKELIASGKDVYIVTGRGLKSALPFAKQCGIPKYMINYNGGSIYDLQTERSVYQSLIGVKEAMDILRIIRENEVFAVVYYEDDFYYETENCFTQSYLSRIQIEGFQRSLDELPTNSFQKILIMASPTQIQQMYKEIMDRHFDNLYVIITHPGMHITKDYPQGVQCLEIMNIDVNKGKTLARLLALRDHNLDQAIAFGDDTNDIEMLSMVGWGLAMGNAKDSVKEIANEVILSNSEDGVADFIERHFLDK